MDVYMVKYTLPKKTPESFFLVGVIKFKSDFKTNRLILESFPCKKTPNKLKFFDQLKMFNF